MTFFCDPFPPARTTKAGGEWKRNSYPIVCEECGKTRQASEAYLTHREGRWVATCAPSGDDPRLTLAEWSDYLVRHGYRP